MKLKAVNGFYIVTSHPTELRNQKHHRPHFTGESTSVSNIGQGTMLLKLWFPRSSYS